MQPENLNVLRHEELPWLTLITCERFDQAREAYARRVVVRAVLVDIHAREALTPYPSPALRERGMTPEEIQSRA